MSDNYFYPRWVKSSPRLRISAEQFEILSQLMRLQEGSDSRGAAYQVLVDGRTIADVSKTTGMQYNAVYQAVSRVERFYKKAKEL